MYNRKMRRKHSTTKSKALTIHAIKRARERYDLDLTQENLAELVYLIQSELGFFVERQSKRVSVWKIPYMDRILKVAYDKERKAIITFLPQE